MTNLKIAKNQSGFQTQTLFHDSGVIPNFYEDVSFHCGFIYSNVVYSKNFMYNSKKDFTLCTSLSEVNKIMV